MDIIIITGILGLIIGSFLNVVIYRLPIILKNEYKKNCLEYFGNESPTITLSIPRSYCPQCKNMITWWQNIPVISYILLRGKCSHCQTIIPWRYPAIEILSCLTTILVTLYFGIGIKTIVILLLTWGLIAAIFIDLEHQLLPDNITLSLLWLGLLSNTANIFTTPTNSIIGAASGYLFLWSINKTFKLIRKIDGMGDGDFKLFAAFGAFLGWQMLPIILLLASLTGALTGIYLIVRKKYSLIKPIPFGPHLAIAGWLTFFLGQKILNWYGFNLI